MKKAIIFDLDGVLVHTDRFHYLAWKSLADSLGIYFDETINNRCRGVSRMDSLEIVLERSDGQYTTEQKMAFAEQKNEKYKEYLATMKPSDLSEDVVYTLNELKRRGYRIAVGSSSKNTTLILKRVGIFEMFDAIADGTMISHSKPNPEVFLKAAQLLGEEPSNCIVVEDAVAGVQAGKNAGMQTIAIGDAATANIADYNLVKLSEMLKML